MALPGELEGLHGATCTCGRELLLRVLHSNAGYYLGYRCPDCGPWSRETGYMSEEKASKSLSDYRNGLPNVRTTGHTGGG